LAPPGSTVKGGFGSGFFLFRALPDAPVPLPESFLEFSARRGGPGFFDRLSQSCSVFELPDVLTRESVDYPFEALNSGNQLLYWVPPDQPAQLPIQMAQGRLGLPHQAVHLGAQLGVGDAHLFGPLLPPGLF